MAINLSLSKLPWYAQIGAFVVVCLGAVFGFWKFYVAEVQADIELRQTRLTALRADIERGVRTARQLPQFEQQVTALEQRLESLRQVLPEEKDVADTLRRIQSLATKSNLQLQKFQPGKVVQQKLYAEIPYKLQAEGTYHNLGYFFDQISKFPRIINISEISVKAKTPPEPNATIIADLVATTFVLQEGKGAPGKPGTVPKQPSLAK
jgi:type IV pilus assembly protein PilO